MAAAAAAATASQALAKVTKLEADIDAKLRDAKIDAVTIQKRDWLESQCKQFENNIKVAGLTYNIKDYHKKNASARKEWRIEMLQRAFIDTNILGEEALFIKNANGKREMKRIIRDAHPLGNKNNATIIIAFTESWLANDIKERVRKGEGLEMTKVRRGKDPETIRVFSHLPIILDCLRNEALKVRRDLIAASNSGKRYICNDSLKAPWVTLYEVDGEKKTAIPFTVEDRRLVNPARTLAIYSLGGNDFKPFRLLSKAEKDHIIANIASDVINPAPAATSMVMYNCNFSSSLPLN